MSVMGRSRRVALIIATVAMIYLGGNSVAAVRAGRQQSLPPVDAVIVLGAAQYDGRPSAQLATRLDTALELWAGGEVGYIVVTGGNQPGDRFTEAEVAASYLVDRGVPAGNVLAEDTGTTTFESLHAVASLVDESGITSTILVTDSYHALRSRLIAERSGIPVSGTHSVTNSVVKGSANVRRYVVEILGVSIGRIIGFRALSGRG